MTRRLFTTMALLCCVLVCFTFVAGIAGKWTSSIKTPDGNDFPLSYTFKIDGDKLTGTATSPRGVLQIADGKVTGDADFTFTLPVNDGTVKHTGKYYAAGDSIGLDVNFKDMKLHTTLKRVTK
jgi:hypothetical protein